MRSPTGLLRLLLRLVAIGLVLVGAVMGSGWVEMLLQAVVDGSAPTNSSSLAASPQALRALAWAIPLLLVGLALLVLTTKRERVISLTRQANDP